MPMLSSLRQCCQQNPHFDLVISLSQAYFKSCSDAIGVLWRYRTEEEVDADGVLQC